MKFARYLQDTQTPEWKNAYIDYRGLKVRLGIIKTQQGDPAGSGEPPEVDDTRSVPTNQEKFDESTGEHLNRGSTTSARVANLSGSEAGPATNNATVAMLAPPVRRRTSYQEKPSLNVTFASIPRRPNTASTVPSQQTPLPSRAPRSPPIFPFFRDSVSPMPPPLHTILANLPATHIRFFNMLDAELEKVESFYAEREKEMNEHAKRLKEQFNELGIHRQMFHQSSARGKAHIWAKRAHFSVPYAFSSWFPDSNTKSEEPDQIACDSILASESGRNEQRGVVNMSNLGPHAADTRRSGDHSRSWGKEVIRQGEDDKDPDDSNAVVSANVGDNTGSPPKHSNNLMHLSFGAHRHPLDPHDPHGYRHAKRRLRKAAIEHYRGLEVLNNYRILNLIGFRKALKKYEKLTKNTVLEAYMSEKVEPSAFASGAMVTTMLKEMEDLFALRFECGDRKKALDRLRVGPFVKTHHFSTFRSGAWLGLALPAIVGGACLAFREHTRKSLPSWNILLYIYSIFLLPVLLALLIGVNIATWARERINYVFIFELNPRSRLDHHEYFELPSFLLCTLCYAFWFSLSQIGPPLLWPLIWLGLTLVVMFNPIHKCAWGPARWWTIKNIAKLGASGVWKVEFTDFWLGDQLCSIVYSLSGMYFVGCFYTRFFPKFPLSFSPALIDYESSQYASFPDNITTAYQSESFSTQSASSYEPLAQEAWSKCSTAPNWQWFYLLAVLPFAVRFVQSLRRYRDSNLLTHLINAGKYGMGMIHYFFYFYWRHQGTPHIGASYVIWLFTGLVYATYACAWDFLMDWSLFKPHAKYPFLRPELVFKSQIPSYYFALVSNICIRFVFLIYIPTDASNITVRTFLASTLEILRRVQWNFYRLENEHLGNMDQYRVTHEVPLPYHFDMVSNEEDEDAPPPVAPRSSQFQRRTARLGMNTGHG
ncbi:EXS family domain containing protein [Tylopilus felleus]